MRGYLWNYGCKSCLVWKQRHIRGFGELLLVLEILQDNSNVGNNDKCGSSLVNTGGLAYGGGGVNYFYSKLHLRCWQGTRICLRYLLY